MEPPYRSQLMGANPFSVTGGHSSWLGSLVVDVHSIFTGSKVALLS